MIKGMSGFGQAQAENSKFKISVQVRTLNHRYLDCSLYLPQAWQSMEAQAKTIIKKKIKRGKINVSFDIASKGSAEPILNPEAVRTYLDLAQRLNKNFRVSKDISFWQLLNLPHVLGQRQRNLVNNPAIKRLLISTLVSAVEKTLRMRRAEGQAIYDDLKKRTALIKANIANIEVKLFQLCKRMSKKLSGEELNSFSRGCDVSEELVRLKFHLANLQRTASVAADDPTGKELDFICQELQREINTLGAKVPDKHVTYLVVKIKSQLEKIREQIQNVE